MEKPKDLSPMDYLDDFVERSIDAMSPERMREFEETTRRIMDTPGGSDGKELK